MNRLCTNSIHTMMSGKRSQCEKETHSNKMEESSNTVERLQSFGSKMGSIKDNILNSLSSAFIEACIIVTVIIILIGAVMTEKRINNRRDSRDYCRPNP